MNSSFKILGASSLLAMASSCSSLLDVNTNPNAATSVTPDNMLANALVVTAANYTGGQTASATASFEDFNTYGAFSADQIAKSGTVSANQEERFYNYTSSYKQNLWALTYDNLNDYQIIQTNGTAQGYPNHAAIARIMKVYNYLLLVDQYGNIPYTKALQGVANTAPSYDDAESVYKDLITQLKGAIDDINAATKGQVVGAEDVIFKGNMTRWKQFANSLRLRILLRESSTGDANRNAYVTAEMATLQSSADGYITTDVIVQPIYAASSNQQNPFYNAYGAYVGGVAAANRKYILPTNFILRQYRSNSDTRLAQLYRPYPTGGTTYVGTDAGERQPPIDNVASTLLLGGYFIRASTQPTILMLLAENLFNKSEAETRGLLTNGNAKTDFQNGIKASFMTTFRDATTTPATVASTTAAGVSQYNAYAAAGAGNALIDWDATTTNVVVHVATDPTINNGGPTDATPRTIGNQEKILYQKYLAENIFGGIEAWSDYRRTNLPNVELSLQAATPGKYPRRLLYPTSELNTNAANIPAGTNQFTPIFWQK